MRRQEVALPLMLLVSYVCLVGSVLFLVCCGCRLFQQVTAQRSENEALRTTMFYLQNQLSAGDCDQGVQVHRTQQGDVLVIDSGEEGYQLFLYQQGGYLMEELVPTGEESDASRAEKICPVKEFSVQQDGSSVLRLHVDGYEALMSLRSGGN